MMLAVCCLQSVRRHTWHADQARGAHLPQAGATGSSMALDGSLTARDTDVRGYRQQQQQQQREQYVTPMSMSLARLASQKQAVKQSVASTATAHSSVHPRPISTDRASATVAAASNAATLGARSTTASAGTVAVSAKHSQVASNSPMPGNTARATQQSTLHQQQEMARARQSVQTAVSRSSARITSTLFDDSDSNDAQQTAQDGAGYATYGDNNIAGIGHSFVGSVEGSSAVDSASSSPRSAIRDASGRRTDLSWSQRHYHQLMKNLSRSHALIKAEQRQQWQRQMMAMAAASSDGGSSGPSLNSSVDGLGINQAEHQSIAGSVAADQGSPALGSGNAALQGPSTAATALQLPGSPSSPSRQQAAATAELLSSLKSINSTTRATCQHLIAQWGAARAQHS